MGAPRLSQRFGQWKDLAGEKSTIERARARIPERKALIGEKKNPDLAPSLSSLSLSLSFSWRNALARLSDPIPPWNDPPETPSRMRLNFHASARNLRANTHFLPTEARLLACEVIDLSRQFREFRRGEEIAKGAGRKKEAVEEKRA